MISDYFLWATCLFLCRSNEWNAWRTASHFSNRARYMYGLFFLKLKAYSCRQTAGKSQMYTACSDYITWKYPLISFNFHPNENLCNPMRVKKKKSLTTYFIISLHRMNQQQGQHLSQCKGSFSPEGKAMEDFRGLKNSSISKSTDDLRKGEWISHWRKI